MEGASQDRRGTSPTPSPSHRRNSSNSSILSKFPFLRTSPEKRREQTENAIDDDAPATTPRPAARPSASVIQYQRTRRRRGSLRKAALLGRGAQRERRESRPLVIDTSHAAAYGLDPTAVQTQSPSPIESLDLNATPGVLGARMPMDLHLYLEDSARCLYFLRKGHRCRLQLVQRHSQIKITHLIHLQMTRICYRYLEARRRSGRVYQYHLDQTLTLTV
ncbi:hypothetical protein NXS19_012621 [Fusarium pseudograminearum]|nr:hypothetical protein NXS19_012621 [Fusarium pseudograminearum]